MNTTIYKRSNLKWVSNILQKSKLNNFMRINLIKIVQHRTWRKRGIGHLERESKDMDSTLIEFKFAVCVNPFGPNAMKLNFEYCT